MTDIFLSYAKEDRERVAPIANMLQSYGLTVFWDVETPPGESWRAFIANKLSEADCAVVIWSKNSINKEWVIEEIDQAKRQEKRILPLRIDDVDPPFGFRMIQAVSIDIRNNEALRASLTPSIELLFDWLGRPSLIVADPQSTKRNNQNDATTDGDHQDPNLTMRLPTWGNAWRTIGSGGISILIAISIAIFFDLSAFISSWELDLPLYRISSYLGMMNIFYISLCMGIILGCAHWNHITAHQFIYATVKISAVTIVGSFIASFLAFMSLHLTNYFIDERFDVLMANAVGQSSHLAALILGILIVTKRFHGLRTSNISLCTALTLLCCIMGATIAAIFSHLAGRTQFFSILGFDSFIVFSFLSFGLLFSSSIFFRRRRGHPWAMLSTRNCAIAAALVGVGAGLGDLFSYIPKLILNDMRDRVEDISSLVSSGVGVLWFVFRGVGIMFGIAIASRHLSGSFENPKVESSVG